MLHSEALKTVVAQLSKPASQQAPVLAASSIAAPAVPVKQKKADVTPEILVMLAAAATAFLTEECASAQPRCCNRPMK